MGLERIMDIPGILPIGHNLISGSTHQRPRYMPVIGIAFLGIQVQHLEITYQQPHLFTRKGKHRLGRSEYIGIDGIQVDVQIIDKLV